MSEQPHSHRAPMGLQAGGPMDDGPIRGTPVSLQASGFHPRDPGELAGKRLHPQRNHRRPSQVRRYGNADFAFGAIAISAFGHLEAEGPGSRAASGRAPAA